MRSKTVRAKVGTDGQICGRFSMSLAETGRNAVFNRAESSEPRPLSETPLAKPQVRESRAKPARKTPAIADRKPCDLSQWAAKSTAFLVISATAANSSATGAGPSHQDTGHRRARDLGACADNTLEPSAGQGRGPCAGGQSRLRRRARRRGNAWAVRGRAIGSPSQMHRHRSSPPRFMASSAGQLASRRSWASGGGAPWQAGTTCMPAARGATVRLRLGALVASGSENRPRRASRCPRQRASVCLVLMKRTARRTSARHR